MYPPDNGKNHFICYYNTERDGAVPVLIISLLDHRHVNQNQRVIIFHFNTGTLFLIQRGSEIVYLNLKLLRNLKISVAVGFVRAIQQPSCGSCIS